MADAIITFLRQSLPQDIADLTGQYLTRLEQGEYESLLTDPQAKALFGHADDENLANIKLEDFPLWSDYIFQRLGSSLADRSIPALGKQVMFWCIGYAALLSFLRASVTGPPLPFQSAKLVLPAEISESKAKTQETRQVLLESLRMDGIAPYRLTPNVELLCLADAIMTSPPILKNVGAARWAKMRIAFIQQRLLSEVSSALQEVIYDDLELLAPAILETAEQKVVVKEEFLLERSSVHIHHGLDKLARSDLEKVKELRGFEFKMTGLLGKRTKFQRDDLSQMVVLARSKEGTENGQAAPATQSESQRSAPTTVDLNDDTLLNSISFTRKEDGSTTVSDDEMPPALASLDPSDQPLLQPLDSAILLSLASSITNTSPQDGLTREETLPYATRVLDGGSSNWQVYTQALLVRSRIEGYRARTTERGLLQLQALVDQVIADTTGSANASEGAESTFLPRGKQADSAPASERLRYIFQLASPSRWELEAELAARWVQLGGLRSALDIYERLEMWAEAALCWAATEREDRARRAVRRQLFHATKGADAESEEGFDADEETWNGPARDPAPQDAPRLYCILGDIDSSTEMYEQAWQVSGQRYARAQRSLGRYYLASKDFVKAADAYAKSLKANQLNHASWFALGCALLELAQFPKAVEAFSRCVQLDDTDAESWSNLAAALLSKEPDVDEVDEAPALADDEDNSATAKKDAKAIIKQNRQDALNALKRAAVLKHDSYRIWQNVLIVAASTVPPDYPSLLAAQKRVIELRGSTDGEGCIDFEIMDALVQHVVASSDTYDPSQPGLARIVVKFVDESLVPLITNSAPLWRLVSKLALWRGKPGSALDAEEKAWRAVTSQPGWETESAARWDEVVEATVRLCDSYESLGPRERTEGMAAGSGETVAKDWKFKARSAVRGIMGKGKASWDGSDGWERLREVMEGLKG